MPAAKLNLIVEQGTTFRRRLFWRDKKRKPVNLTGYTARMQIRTNGTPPEVQIELSTANGKITMSATGQIDIVLTPAETANLVSGTYDMTVTATNGDVYRLIQGKVSVSERVTQ